MEIALSSTDNPGGFKKENAINSNNGLALLASLTLKNALNINCNNNNKQSNNNNNNHLMFNNNNLRLQNVPQHGFVLSSSSSSSSSSTSTTTAITTSVPPSRLQHTQEQQNVFTFTTAGLQAIAASTNITTTSSHNQQKAAAALAGNNNDITNSSSFSTVHDRNVTKQKQNVTTNNSNNITTTSSANDPTTALLECLNINIKPVSTKTATAISSSASTSTSTFTTSVSSSSSNNNNNNSNINNNTKKLQQNCNTVNINNNNGVGNGSKHFKIPSDILDDLASRFIINVPDMELSNLIRICFQIELAHWFYLDFFCASDEEKKLHPCGIKQFAVQLFEHIPFLTQHLASVDKILDDWKNYKLSVPTYGAILISEDLNYCLLVQSYFAKSSWGFPKGKVNENEDPVHCAAREVYEETGYDINEFIVPNDFIEAVINYQYTRLYIVRDVSLETKFSPRTRNEIKCCDWFPIDSLPVSKNDAISKAKLGINANSFFMIMPFVKRLKKWVNDKRNGVDTRRKYSGGCGSPHSTSPLTTVIFQNGGQPNQNKSSSKKQNKHRNNINNCNNNNNNNNNASNSNDDKNALNNGAPQNPNNKFATSSCSNTNSNRCKRQRHKSMGDLDGIKLNNYIHNVSKSNNNNNNNCGSNLSTVATPTASHNGVSITNNNNNNNNHCNSNQKQHQQQNRATKIVAAGSNVFNNSNPNNCNNSVGSAVAASAVESSTKRQLFHSQSQTTCLQQNSGEKNFSSFDLIRKEKQLLKAAQAKSQKQTQQPNINKNINNTGRQRAKSQSDKMCLTQQQTNLKQNNNNKQRLQKQQSMIVSNTNMQQQQQLEYHLQSSSSTNANNPTFNQAPLSGTELLALAAAQAVNNNNSNNNNNGNIANNTTLSKQKPRPSSVSLHFPDAYSKREPFEYNVANASNTATTSQQEAPPQLQRMASGTNLRILKRSTSHQPQPIMSNSSNARPTLQFTPSFNSWTNFTFTKNFIANVFC